MTSPMDPLRHSVSIEVESIVDVRAHLALHGDLRGVIVNGVDLTHEGSLFLECDLEGAVLIGCTASPDLLAHATASGAAVFPAFSGIPYEPYRRALYDAETLYEGFDPSDPDSHPRSLDARIYRHWVATGGAGGGDMVEALARRIHDHSITDAIADLVEGRRVVAIMGGHGLQRDDPGYASVARISRALARSGMLLASGGGPGAMEATHLGAWLATHQDRALPESIELLSVAPGFEASGEWLASAFSVRERFPLGPGAPVSLGVPTWLYGHEPPNVFATHIAKYFANAVREDGLLTIARHGIVFTPGSAGTVQEIFQDATQNHYETVGAPSPMVLFGAEFWTKALPVLPLLEQLAGERRWLGEVHLTDDEDEVVSIIEAHRRAD